MSNSNQPFMSSNQWGSPSSWDKTPAQFQQQIQQQKAKQRMEQKQLKKNWGQPSIWNKQYKSINQTQNSKGHWGNPFGWPESLGKTNSNIIQSQLVKQSGFNSNIQNQKGWSNYQYQCWPSQNSNLAQSSSNNSGWGAFKSNLNQIEEAKLKGDHFFQYLKQKEIDDEVICILANEGINSLQILRACTQQALAVKGIKLSEVIKLKSI